MSASFSSYQIANLLIEGAVITISFELILKNLLVCLITTAHASRENTRATNFIRYLKLLMAITMIIKTAILCSSSLRDDCRVAERVAEAFYHSSYLSGSIILLHRVTVLTPADKRTIITICHTVLMIFRFIAGVVDVIYVQISKFNAFCTFQATHEVGIVYTILDTFIDIYVSTMVAVILCSHIKLLKRDGVAGNISLYSSLVLSNVIRTVILTVINLVCAVYFIVASDDPILEIIFWPISNLSFIVLVGFDTDLTKTIQKLNTSLIFHDVRRRQNQEQHLDLLSLSTDDVQEKEQEEENHSSTITDTAEATQQALPRHDRTSAAAVAIPSVTSAIRETIVPTTGDIDVDRYEQERDKDDAASIFSTTHGEMPIGESNDTDRPSRLQLRHFSSDSTAVTKSTSAHEPLNSSTSVDSKDANAERVVSIRERLQTKTSSNNNY